MITRRKEEDDTIRQDAVTMASRRARWTLEFNTKTHLREAFLEFFDMPKMLAPLTKLLPEPEKVHRRLYDGERRPNEWPDVFTIRAELENFNHRVSILCQLRDSVTPALSNVFKIEMVCLVKSKTDFFENSRNLRILVKNIIFLPKHFFRLKCCPLSWKFKTEKQFRIHALISLLQRFKNVLLKIVHHIMQIPITKCSIKSLFFLKKKKVVKP